MPTVREKFQDELNEIQGKLLEIGKLTEVALLKSIEALEQQNIELALEVIDGDSEIDLLYEEINDFSILLIAKQQPVAIDLRRIIVGIKIATDIERIADFAVNIGKATIRIGNAPFVEPMVHIKEMSDITINMLRLSLEAFTDGDTAKAKMVADMDDRVDELYGQTIQELLKMNLQNQELLSQISQLSFTTRYLERAADHVTNISEHIFYLVKGRSFDLNN